MSDNLTVDTLAARLHRDGWSTGDVAMNYPEGRAWIVSGQRAGRWIIPEADSQSAAWSHFADADLLYDVQDSTRALFPLRFIEAIFEPGVALGAERGVGGGGD
jgi:hypothetical protein